MHQSVVKEAAKNGAVHTLINNVNEVTPEQVKALQKLGGFSKKEAVETAAAAREFDDAGTILGKQVNLSGYALRREYNIPRSMEKSAAGDVFIHLKEHGKAKRLGKGAYGKATKSLKFAKGRGSPEVVVQKAERQEIRLLGVKVGDSRAFKEQQILATLSEEPYVIKMESGGAYTGSKGAEKYGTVLEHCDGGKLTASKMKKLSKVERWEFYLKTLQGAKGIQEMGYVHSDLKPDNILIKTVNGKPEPRIADFGLSAEINQDCVGFTPGYLAPECVDALIKGQGSTLDPKADVFAAGVVGLQTVAGVQPPWLRGIGIFRPFAVLGLRNKKNVEDLGIDWKKVDPEFRAVLKGMLEPDPNNRMTFDEAIDAVQKGLDIAKMEETMKKSKRK